VGRIQEERVVVEEKNILAMLMSGMPIRIVSDSKPEHHSLAPEERELADSLVRIAEKKGKFNEDGKGIWAGYKPASSNTKASIGVKCSNCVLYLGGGQCRIIQNTVEPEGKCRFAVIPDGVVEGYKSAEDGIEYKVGDKCPTATRDIAVNLKNRGKAIKTAMYGPLNPSEENNENWAKIGSEWDVTADEARKQRCGNCAVFIVTPEMKDCIKTGLTEENKMDDWDSIDAAGELGYCEAFDFKCASKRTCRAWVTGGPVTRTKK